MSIQQSPRKATNLSLDADHAAEAGVRRAVVEQWRRDNAEAIATSNRWVEENGLPLDCRRQF